MLTSIAGRLFTARDLILNLTVEEQAFERVRRDLVPFLEGLYPATEKRLSVTANAPEKSGLKTAGAVNYVACTGSIREAGPYTGALRVMQSLLSSGYLWTNVRVRGGAYGCMCGFSPAGSGYFVSYRDPNVGKTLEVYRQIPAYLEELELEEEELTGFIISSIGSMDTPLSPSLQGDRDFSYYRMGITQEFLQRERDQVIGCSLADIRALAPYVQAILNSGCQCIVGGAGKLEEEAAQFDTLESLP